MPDIDQDRVARLGAEIMRAVVGNYQAGPPSRDRVWESLNALAFAAATIIAGTGDRSDRRKATQFFDRAVSENVAGIVRQLPTSGSSVSASMH